jgi:hypothetical protein
MRTYDELSERRNHLLVVSAGRWHTVLLEISLPLSVHAPDDVVQHRRRQDSLVARLLLLALAQPDLGLAHARSDQSIPQRIHQFLPTWPGIPSEDDARSDGDVNLESLDEMLKHLDELGRGRSIADLGSKRLPARFEHLPSRVDELDAVVGRRVVRGGDHHSNRLASELLRAEDGEETDSEKGCGEVVSPVKIQVMMKGQRNELQPRQEDGEDREEESSLGSEASRSVRVLVAVRLAEAVRGSRDGIDGKRGGHDGGRRVGREMRGRERRSTRPIAKDRRGIGDTVDM